MAYIIGTVMVGVATGFLFNSIPYAFVVIGAFFIIGAVFELISGKRL